MANRHLKDSDQHWIVRFLPLETLKDAQNLFHRYQEGKAFRLYVASRIWLVIPVCLLILLIAIACTAGTVVFFAETHPLLALPAIILVPVILFGSLFVLGYAFFSWLENRAMTRTLGFRAKQARGPISAWFMKKLRADMGAFPPIPWALAIVVLFLPLAMLASFAWIHALVLIVLAIVAPIVYAVFDR